MSRIATPASIDAAPAAARPALKAVKKQLGSVPNLFRLVANSPAALEGYLGLNGALAKGALDARTRERIALAVAEINGCGYCLSAHSYLGKVLAEIAMSREAVAAAIDLGDRERDPFAGAGIERAFGERAIEAEITLQGCRAVGDDAEKVGNAAELFLDGFEGGPCGCGGGIDRGGRRDAGHSGSPGWGPACLVGP